MMPGRRQFNTGEQFTPLPPKKSFFKNKRNIWITMALTPLLLQLTAFPRGLSDVGESPKETGPHGEDVCETITPTPHFTREESRIERGGLRGSRPPPWSAAGKAEVWSLGRAGIHPSGHQGRPTAFVTPCQMRLFLGDPTLCHIETLVTEFIASRNVTLSREQLPTRHCGFSPIPPPSASGRVCVSKKLQVQVHKTGRHLFSRTCSLQNKGRLKADICGS